MIYAIIAACVVVIFLIVIFSDRSVQSKIKDKIDKRKDTKRNNKNAEKNLAKRIDKIQETVMEKPKEDPDEKIDFGGLEFNDFSSSAPSTNTKFDDDDIFSKYADGFNFYDNSFDDNSKVSSKADFNDDYRSFDDYNTDYYKQDAGDYDTTPSYGGGTTQVGAFNTSKVDLEDTTREDESLLFDDFDEELTFSEKFNKLPKEMKAIFLADLLKPKD